MRHWFPAQHTLTCCPQGYSGFGWFTLCIIMDSKGEGIYSIHASEGKKKSRNWPQRRSNYWCFPLEKYQWLDLFFLFCIHLQQTSTNNKSTDHSASIHRPPRSTTLHLMMDQTLQNLTCFLSYQPTASCRQWPSSPIITSCVNHCGAFLAGGHLKQTTFFI